MAILIGQMIVEQEAIDFFWGAPKIVGPSPMPNKA
jgi:hypothetical protein